MAQQLVEIGTAVKAAMSNAGAAPDEQLRTVAGKANMADMITAFQLAFMADTQPEVTRASTKNLSTELQVPPRSNAAVAAHIRFPLANPKRAARASQRPPIGKTQAVTSEQRPSEQRPSE